MWIKPHAQTPIQKTAQKTEKNVYKSLKHWTTKTMQHILLPTQRNTKKNAENNNKNTISAYESDTFQQ